MSASSDLEERASIATAWRNASRSSSAPIRSSASSRSWRTCAAYASGSASGARAAIALLTCDFVTLPVLLRLGGVMLFGSIPAKRAWPRSGSVDTSCLGAGVSTATGSGPTADGSSSSVFLADSSSMTGLSLARKSLTLCWVNRLPRLPTLISPFATMTDRSYSFIPACSSKLRTLSRWASERYLNSGKPSASGSAPSNGSVVGDVSIGEAAASGPSGGGASSPPVATASSAAASGGVSAAASTSCALSASTRACISSMRAFTASTSEASSTVLTSSRHSEKSRSYSFVRRECRALCWLSFVPPKLMMSASSFARRWVIGISRVAASSLCCIASITSGSAPSARNSSTRSRSASRTAVARAVCSCHLASRCCSGVSSGVSSAASSDCLPSGIWKSGISRGMRC